MSILRKDIQERPWYGAVEVSGQLRAKASVDIVPLQHITPNNVYDVILVKGLGTVENVVIIDDSGKPQIIASYFFEEVEE